MRRSVRRQLDVQVLGTEMNGTIITRMREIGTTEEAEGAPMVLFELAVFAGTIDKQSFVESTRVWMEGKKPALILILSSSLSALLSLH